MIKAFRYSLPLLIFLCCILIALADWLFYLHPVGWNLGIYSIFVLAALSVRSRFIFRHKAGRRIILALFGLVVAMISQPGPIAFLLTCLGLLTLALIHRNGWTSSTLIWIRRWTTFGFKVVYQFLHDLRAFQHWQNRGHGISTLARMRSGFLNWSIPVLFSLIFIGLFRMANPIVSGWLESLDRALTQIHLDLPRFFFWGFTGTLLWALFRVRVKGWKTTSVHMTPPRTHVSPAFLTRCLTLFNLVFAVQTILDLTYLWGGASLPKGLTYAAYAHRGAYPLIFTALLAGLFVLITFRENAATVEMRTPRKLVYLWLAQNVFLTISSIARLSLYMQVYNLTRWRIAAALWMLLIAAGLILVGLRILQSRSNLWLLNSNFLSVLALLYACCFVNFDSMIAWYNVTHCREIKGQGVWIDLYYLRHLGPESIPALEWLSKQPSAPRVTAEKSAEYSQYLLAELQHQLRDWRGWTYRRHVLFEKYPFSSVRATGRASNALP